MRQNVRLPRGVKHFFRLLYSDEEYQERSGDLEETYRELGAQSGCLYALIWLIAQGLRLVVLAAINRLFWRGIMVKSYLNNMLRQLRRHRGYFVLNITGFTLGLVCVMLVLVYVRFEFSYDRFHKDADCLYRVLVIQDHAYQGKNEAAVLPPAFAPALKANIPEVIEVCRVTGKSLRHQRDGQWYNESGVGFVDPSFLTLFNFPLIRGDAKTALSERYSVVISETVAKKYFGEEDPLGQVFHGEEGRDFQVTGGMRDMPENTYFSHYDFLVPMDMIEVYKGAGALDLWKEFDYAVFFKLSPTVAPVEVEKKIESFFASVRPNFITGCKVQPLRDVHFYTRALFEQSPSADKRNVMVLLGIGLAILAIACFNDINLATARASMRAREICVRKVSGARRGALVRQFIGESVGLSVLSGVVAVGLTALLLPRFGTFVGRDFGASTLLAGANMALIGALVVGVGAIAGLYPALLLSSFSPALLLRPGASATTGRKPVLRSGLLLVQFIISIVMLFVTLVMNCQLRYMHQKDLGFVKDHVLTVNGWNAKTDMRVITEALLSYPGIEGIALSDQRPSYITNATVGAQWEGKPQESVAFFRLVVDERFLDFYGIPLVAGRSFSKDRATDIERAVMVNETAAKTIGWEEPVGEKLTYDQAERSVIGVVKDFHFASLRLAVAPLLIRVDPSQCKVISLKVHPNQTAAVLAYLEEKWKTWAPDQPLNYSFLDDRIDRMYRTDRRLYQSIQLLAGIAVALACFGLVGLSAFSMSRRTKEVAVRKVLGAPSGHIMALLARSFLRWVMLANLVAWPAGYLLVGRWLENFAYRITLSWWMFLLPSLAAGGIALLTISYHTVKAGRANPIKGLRFE